MTERLVIWGAGGHGRVVADLARALGYDVLGFVDRAADKPGSPNRELATPIIMSEDDLLQGRLNESQWAGVRIALGIGDNSARLRCFSEKLGNSIVRLTHPLASVSPSAMIGRGSVVCAQAVVNADASIGEAVIVNSAAVVEHDCRLADGVHVSPGAVLAGDVTVGRGAWIGAGAVLIPGVTVGDSSIIGAGAVVIRDVAPHTVSVGNPARTLRRLS